MNVTRDSLPKGTRTDLSVRSTHSGSVQFRGERAMNGPRQRKRCATGTGSRHFYVVHPVEAGKGRASGDLGYERSSLGLPIGCNLPERRFGTVDRGKLYTPPLVTLVRS